MERSSSVWSLETVMLPDSSTDNMDPHQFEDSPWSGDELVDSTTSGYDNLEDPSFEVALDDFGVEQWQEDGPDSSGQYEGSTSPSSWSLDTETWEANRPRSGSPDQSCWWQPIEDWWQLVDGPWQEENDQAEELI